MTSKNALEEAQEPADGLEVENSASGETDEGGSVKPWWRSKRAIIFGGIALIIVAALVTTVLVLQREPEAPEPVAVTVPVALDGIRAPEGLKIGVVVTLGQGQAEGSEWSAAAEGAVVAQYRLAAGGSDVEIVVEDDHGSSGGSADAVSSLVEQGVSGIVFATNGEHMTAGLEAAAEAKVPVLLPYAEAPDHIELPSAWSFAPDTHSYVSALNDTISGYEYPLLLDAGPGLPDGVKTSETLRPVEGDIPAFAAEAAVRTGADPSSHGAYSGTPDEEAAEPEPEPLPRADALVLSGHPRTLALLVAQLQARNVSVPLVLAPNATSPAFAQALSEQEGSVSTNLQTVGENVGDAVALGKNDQARALSAYLQAVRQIADDPESLNLLGDTPFVERAVWADAKSHDAVLAIVSAAGAAGSTDAETVAAELQDLQLTAADGAAAFALDFSNRNAGSGEVYALHATAQAFGLRPTNGTQLSWFPAPTTP